MAHETVHAAFQPDSTCKCLATKPHNLQSALAGFRASVSQSNPASTRDCQSQNDTCRCAGLLTVAAKLQCSMAASLLFYLLHDPLSAGDLKVCRSFNPNSAPHLVVQLGTICKCAEAQTLSLGHSLWCRWSFFELGSSSIHLQHCVCGCQVAHTSRYMY